MSGISFESISGESISGDDNIETVTVNRLSRTVTPYSGYGGQGLQVFTVARVVSLSPGQSLSIDATPTTPPVIAIRVSADTDYQLNGVGEVGTFLAGSSTGFAKHIAFVTFPSGATIEVM